MSRADKILDSFSIVVDTREQDTPRARQRYKALEVPYSRAVLDYGDYTYNLTLPDGKKLHDTSNRIKPKIVVERKQNLDELAMCFTRSRDRFEREFSRAKEAGAKVYLLVENATWDMIFDGQYRSQFRPRAFIASIMAWINRYDMTPVFCHMSRSGWMIREILYRDARERLERGEW